MRRRRGEGEEDQGEEDRQKEKKRNKDEKREKDKKEEENRGNSDRASEQPMIIETDQQKSSATTA